METVTDRDIVWALFVIVAYWLGRYVGKIHGRYEHGKEMLEFIDDLKKSRTGNQGPYSMYGRTQSWLESKWHTAADIDSEFTYCGMRLPLAIHDDAPPPPDLRCGRCEKVQREIERLISPGPTGSQEWKP